MVPISACFPHSLHIRQMLSSGISLKLVAPGVLGHHRTLRCHLADTLPPCPDLFCGFGGVGDGGGGRGEGKKRGGGENSSEPRLAEGEDG